MSQFQIRNLNMAVHSSLNAFSFDILLIEIGQEIKLI
jgi:hypothetical protein